jgi:hypothetical protein
MPNADYEGQVQGQFVQGMNAGDYNVVARFADPPVAERAVAEMEAHGFDNSDVWLLGSAQDAVSPASGLTAADAQVLGSHFRDLLIGGVAGAVVGAIAGIIVLAIFHPAFGVHMSPVAYLAAALIGAIVGLIGGALVGGFAGLDRSQAGRDTYGLMATSGPMLVGVRAPGPKVQAAIAELRSLGAQDVRQVTPDPRVVV